MKVLATAYACRPNSGSEEGNGWHLAHQLTRFGEVRVITPSHNRAAIEAVCSPVRFVYVDVPGWQKQSLVELYRSSLANFVSPTGRTRLVS